MKKDKLDAVLDAKLMSKRELIARQIENDVSVLVIVSVQGVVALGGHFATFCQEVDFYDFFSLMNL